MNKVNYDAEMVKTINSLGERKPKLMLHACCAPCASACLERIKDYFDIYILFYNPNIEHCEYVKRKGELIKLLNSTGWGKLWECEHDTSPFYRAVRGLEECPEGGERCKKCFELRLGRTAAEAKLGGFDYFATTLTLSPLKNAELINEIGKQVGEACGVEWLCSDFKKRDGYLESIRLSQKYGLYRQNFCGCIYSLPSEDG